MQRTTSPPLIPAVAAALLLLAPVSASSPDDGARHRAVEPFPPSSAAGVSLEGHGTLRVAGGERGVSVALLPRGRAPLALEISPERLSRGDAVLPLERTTAVRSSQRVILLAGGLRLIAERTGAGARLSL